MNTAVRCSCLLLLFALTVYGQNPCSPPANYAPAPDEINFLTPQQEMDLGDVVAEHIEHEYELVRDDKLNSHLQAVGDRLLKYSRTELRVTFRLIDIPEVNAFTLPGGRIYVTRKLVAFAQSEDELAGILGHELGHVIWRHPAIGMSEMLRKVLGVTSVGDRRDIYNKYNQLLDNARRKRDPYSEKREEREQLAADQMAVYLLARAGYEPRAFADIWDRMTESKGKTGTWLGDFFGTIKPETRRLRESVKTAETLPSECRARQEANSAQQFRSWQSLVIESERWTNKESLHGVIARRQLTPALRPDISQLKFSPDGTYLIAQDETGIYVLTRQPFAFRFRIDAPEAHPAVFSPDGQSIAFYDGKLRVQKWSIPEQKRIWVRELVLNKGCIQTRISPDGELLACYGHDFELKLINTGTSTTVFEKKNFFVPDTLGYFSFLLAALQRTEDDEPLRLLNLRFSPDARYLVASHGTTSIAIDVPTLKQVPLDRHVRDVIGREFTFIGPDRIAGMKGLEGDKGAVVKFPTGEMVRDDLVFGAAAMESASRPDFILLRPIINWAVGLFHIDSGKVIAASRTPSYDVFGNQFVSEMMDGQIGLCQLSATRPEYTLKLPQTTLGRVRAFDVSPDLKVIALSQRRRGGVWNLETGERMFHVRGFRGAWVGDDSVYVDFPEFAKAKRAIGRLQLSTRQASEHRAVVEFSPDKPERAKDKEKNKKDVTKGESGQVAARPEETRRDWSVWQSGPLMITLKPPKTGSNPGWELEVADTRSGQVLWTRVYRRERPTFEGTVPAEHTMVLSWSLDDAAAREEVKADPKLKERINSLREKEGVYLLEVLDTRTGTPLGKLLIETGKDSFRIESAQAAGDWVVILDNKNRVMLYSLATGDQITKIFGSYVMLSKDAGLLAIENSPGKIGVYSLKDMQKVDEYVFASEVSRMRFSGDGKRLFVLTDDQTAYWLDMTALAMPGKNINASN